MRQYLYSRFKTALGVVLSSVLSYLAIWDPLEDKGSSRLYCGEVVLKCEGVMLDDGLPTDYFAMRNRK